ncbi:unnamed protein product, partial [Adineta steineri]
FISNQLEKRAEKQTGLDLNDDGYVGGQGIEGKIEGATHIDLNRDNIIGRPLDRIPGDGVL